MKKIVFILLLLVISFFATWFVLTKIDWVSILKVDKATKTTEKKLGDLIWEFYDKTEREIKSKNAVGPVDSILQRICVKNNINPSGIKMHIILKDEVNAFALPDNRLVIHSGLILACENESELAGVMAHELAHIELNHVMKKLVKEVGLSILISIATGRNGSEKIVEIVQLLSSSAYDRSLEEEADIRAVEYLKKAKIDPEHFAHFLYRLSERDNDATKYLSWVSTHPDSKERAEYIIESGGGKMPSPKPILTESSWQKLNEYLEEE